MDGVIASRLLVDEADSNRMLDMSRLQLAGSRVEPSSDPMADSSEALTYSTTRQRLFEERSRQMLSKYQLSIEPQYMPQYMATTPERVERVHKSIRIRVHHYCHRCNVAFTGTDKICDNCHHTRCSKCKRQPVEREHSRDSRVGVVEAAEGREPLKIVQHPRKNTLLVHKPPVQRVRRKCHRCDAAFTPATAAECSVCGHARCTRCPRNPEKRTKWTHGYPGDAKPSSDEDDTMSVHNGRQDRVFRKIRQRVRWNCEQCESLFLQGDRTCRDCGHTRCEDCDRFPAKHKHEHEHSMADLPTTASLHQRLSELALSTVAAR